MYQGLTTKFHTDRPLSSEDHRYRLKPEERLDYEPYADLVTIKLNSSYLEVVDKFYAHRGSITGFAMLFAALPIWIFAATWMDYEELLLSVYVGREQQLLSSAVFATVMGAILLAAMMWLAHYEVFRYTHYPIRLNRRSRMIHVFRLNGPVLTVPWDEVFFTLDYQQEVAGRAWEIRGHVLDADGVTVRETFGLGMQSSGDAEGLRALRSHWEFYRRYMEDGPQAVKHCVKVCMPVDGRREPFVAGSRCIFSHVDNLKAHPVGVILWVFMLPLNWLSVIGRWIAMQTSRIPKWPDEIEAVNVIEPGDPHVVDERINPPELRR